MEDSPILTSTRLPPERYLELIRANSARLSEVAELGLDAPVPTCPGWTVADVLTHTAQVYQHKIACLGRDTAPPWPMPELEGLEPRQFFADSTARLLAELEARGPEAVSFTWWPEDQTVGFWFRRMAQEVAVHRYDAELAHEVPTPLDADLAVDGVDEVLRLMLGGPWWAEGDTEHPVNATVRVKTGGRFWMVVLGPDSVSVTGEGYNPSPEVGDPATLVAPAAEVTGAPDAVLLWLWGRLGDDSVEFRGDAQLRRELRGRLAEATQ